MKSLEELRALKAQMQGKMGIRNDDAAKIKIVVGMATCGIAAGARPVLTAFMDEIAKKNLTDVALEQSGCIGLCQYEPIVEVYKDGEKTTYVKMSVAKAVRVMEEHVVGGNVVTEYTLGAYL